VPFTCATGKTAAATGSEVAIQFKDVPQGLFNAHPDVPLEPTVLSLRVQPGGGTFDAHRLETARAEGTHLPREMEFNYAAPLAAPRPKAYERLLLDVMAGDATLFMRRDATVEAGWSFVMPIWKTGAQPGALLAGIRAGTWGPLEAIA